MNNDTHPGAAAVTAAGTGPEPDADARTAVQVDEKGVRKVAFAAFVGTALEWYDYYLFGTAAALVFNHLYFTDLNALAATMASFATFGVGFVARPFGAFLFGLLGDRIGRKPTLIISIVAIGTATGVVGLLPTYESIGVVAPILLTLLRLLQGLAVGGEWGGATTLAIEHAPAEKRGRYAAMVQIGSPAGTLLSSMAFSLVLLLPDDAVDSWGWRLPFLAAFPLLVVAMLIRMQAEESPVFEQIMAEDEKNEAEKGSAFDVFRKGWKQLIVAIAVALLGVGGFYVLNTFVISYATGTLGVERQAVVNATLVAAVVQILVIVPFGRVSERIGPGRVVVFGGILTAVAAWPLFALINTGSVAAITVAVALGIGMVTISYSVTGALLSELFPAKLRYSGVALGYNLAGALTGFLPFIATALMNAQDEPSATPAIVLLVVISLLTALGGYVGERMRVEDDVVVKAG
ncbi:Proline/betaine transporter [Corynebacterium provencense]|uniref:Proline/betaine transporter n=1 Tax=Corynebacterium provencense TaxID=1737425 RepID=A0A2Z3YRD5_9CORY|nr:MFS transporter [Corynebacterium provencense]AWT25074.1 Proline/betaine transporter [Corynebacterium provencense]